ncbi:TPA: hypothetical protein ACH3X3_012725 [Trebouxia sp. C0006]
MSQTNLADPDVVAESDQEVIDVPDDSASQSAGNKRAPGRPASDAWNNFKRIPNPNPGNSKRKYLGSAEQVELPNMDFGVGTDAYDLNELLE